MSHVSFWLTSFHQQVLESLQCDSGLLQCFLELKILPIISVVIYSLFLVLVILRLYALRSQPRVIEGRNFQIAKLTCIATHGVLALAALVTERVLSALPGRLVLVASVLSVAVIPLVALLSYEEHSKNLAPSAILDVYLLLSFLAELLRANDTRFSRYDTQMRGLTAVTLAVKVLVLVLESTEKEKHIRSREERRSPEDYISIWKKAFFLWLNPFIRLGYNKVLTPGDLLPLDQELTTEHLKDKFQLAWERARWKESKYAIFRALFEALGSAATWPMVPRVLAIVFTFCQPLLLKRLLRYLQTPIDEVSHVEGQALIGAYALLYIGLAISTGQFQRGVFRYLTMVRGCLTSAVYQKTIDAKLGVTKEGAAVTLITTDVERAVMGLQKIHDVWAGAIEVILGAALLANELSWVFLVPLTIAIFLSWGTIYLSGFIQERQLAWMKTSQKRVAVTTSILSSMKGVKFLGITPQMTDLIKTLRIDDVTAANRMRMLRVYTSSLAFAPNIMSPVFTLGAFLIVAATTDRGFDTSRIFASLSLLTLMAHPLGSLFQQFPQIRGAGVALRRVEEYLLLESRQDLRSFEKSLEGNGKSNGYKITERPVSSEGSESSNGKTVPRSQLAHSNAITVESGTFGWTAEKAILKNVSFDIKRSKLTVIVGPVASGKTTLCKGLLGETPITEGKIMVYPGDPSIAFCDQTTFLNNTTIRANIVGVSAYESSWFDTVVDAVALREDIASFPEGDQSFVGSNGITLSGGQRQRVSIARAVYARKGIAIFDDVVSGLDAKTQKHVFERVFAEGGLLAQSGTTVILSTHAVHLLPSAHHIIALGTKGEIVEQGTFRDLDTGDGYIKSLAISVLGAASSAPEDALLPPKESGKSQGGAKDYQKSLLRQTSDFATYVYYFRAIGAKTMTTLLTFGFIFSTLIVLPQLWIRVWTNPDNSSPWTGGWSNVAYWGVYAGLQGTCYVFLCLFVHHAFIVLIADSGLRLHWETLKTVMAAPMSFFSDTDTGSITNRFTQDMQLIDGLLPGGLMNFITCSLTMISQAIMIAIASPFVALTYPPIILVFSVIQRYYLRTSQQLRIIDIEAKEPLYTHVLETMKGLVTVRAFGWSDSYVATCNDILDGAQRPAYLLWIVQQWLTMVLDLTGAMIAVLVVSLAVNLRSDSGFVAVALLSIMSFAAYIRFSVMSWTSVETSMGAISRIKTFSEQTLPEDLENEKGTIDPYWPEKGQIEVQDLTVSYKPGSGKNALNNLSLSIKSGEKIGVCGRTGSGKSTFILSLFRMIEIQQGSVIIDGTDISTIPRQEVRRRLNALPQEPILFSGTWRTNLDPYGFSTDEAMLEGLEKVGLRTTIEDRGGLTGEMNIEALSHGQRQLFCLARAILRPGSVVALDEATSNVDKDTEKKMQDIIRTEFKGRTIIAVAHNLSTLMDFDRIAFLREGQLIEYDSPKALLERDSAFKQLYEAQNSSAAGEGTS